MTRCAVGPDNGPAFAIPKPRGATVHSYFPISIIRSVATAAKAIAIREFERLPLTHAKIFQVFGIVADEAVLVAIIASMLHDDVLVRFR